MGNFLYFSAFLIALVNLHRCGIRCWTVAGIGTGTAARTAAGTP